MNHNTFNKIAVINDMTGFGRCSLSVEMPIISHLGVQCCPVVTAVLSNHSAYESFNIVDYTENLPKYIAEWKKLGLKFNGILTGFYGSTKQFDIAEDFIRDFSDENTVVIIDPIMGDNGIKYSTYNDALCAKMREFVKNADVLTPNLTECCILGECEYSEEMSDNDIKAICTGLRKKLKKGCHLVVTGIQRGNFICNYIAENDRWIKKKSAGQTRCGTGDVFSSIIAADAVRRVDFEKSVIRAADFVKACIVESDKCNIPVTDGVCFEKILYKLKLGEE